MLYCAACAVAALAAFQQRGFAQQDSAAGEMYIRYRVQPSDFFAYRASFASTVKRYYPHADAPSIYQRDLTYFYSESVNNVGKDGIVTIDVNVDSIRIYVKNGPVVTRFDSQNDSMVRSVNLENPELTGTTMIVNKPFMFRMTLDGDYIDHSGWEQWTTLIDTTDVLDSTEKFTDKEYMNDEFLRTLVLPSAGFTYDRRYFNLQHWKHVFPQLIFKTPVIDSAECMIEVPEARNMAVTKWTGKLYPDPQHRIIYEHGLASPETIDSLSGAANDTLALSESGFPMFRVRASSLTMHARVNNTRFIENIDERMEVKLLQYERR